MVNCSQWHTVACSSLDCLLRKAQGDTVTDNAAAAAAAAAAAGNATASRRILSELYAMFEVCSAAVAVTRREHSLSQL